MFTPVDIENKEFKKSLRGYDVYEVEEFLKALVLDYEKLYRDNANYKEKNAMLQDTIASYKGMEETMQNAIIVAQRTSEDIKKSAYERAENIVNEAQIRANDAISQADKAVTELEKKYMALKGEMETFRARMRAMLSTYMELIGDMEEEDKQSRVFSPQARYEVSGFTQIKPEAPENVSAPEAPFREKIAVNPVIEDLLNNKQEVKTEPISVTEEKKMDLDIKKQTFDTSTQDMYTTKEVILNLSDDKSKADAEQPYYDVFKDNSL